MDIFEEVMGMMAITSNVKFRVVAAAAAVVLNATNTFYIIVSASLTFTT
jgi:hypothetical protein